MAGIVPRYDEGPPTYQVADGETITGGQLLEARTGSRVGIAAAGSLKVVGVARTDAKGTSVSQAAELLQPTPAEVAVDKGFLPVTYAAAAAFGDRLIAAASGQVTPVPAASGTYSAAEMNNTRGIVGYCAEPAGVGAAAVGLAYIY